jgi:hypothetical protein
MASMLVTSNLNVLVNPDNTFHVYRFKDLTEFIEYAPGVIV